MVFENCEIIETENGGALMLKELSSAFLKNTKFYNITSKNGTCIYGT